MTLLWNRTTEWDVARWREQASCRLIDQDLFFPVGSSGDAIEQIEAAKKVCESCPVRSPCLQFALETNQEAGIWGATSEEERRRLRRAWLAGRRRSPGPLPDTG